MNSRSLLHYRNRFKVDSTPSTLDDLRRIRNQALENRLDEVKKTNDILLNVMKTKEEKLAELERRYRGVEESPTDRERQQAMRLLGFVDNHLHIAIAGDSFVGKSSLVNAFRGLSDKDRDAAKAGFTETTDRVTRYPASDGRNIIYYDIPGAGTKKVCRYGYFKDQGLYVMNALLLVWCDRVSDTFIDILRNCIKLKIPYLLIRTKCDRYIREFRDEVKEEYGYDENDRRFVKAMYKKLSRFAEASYADAIDGIKSAYEGAGVDSPCDEELGEHVFLVNKNSLRKFVVSGEEDENALNEKLLMSSITRLLT